MAEMEIFNEAGETVAQSRNYYDEEALESATAGNLTTESYWLDTTGEWLDITYDRNEFGLTELRTNARGYDTELVYDEHDMYPYYVENALGHRMYRIYDLATGEVITEINPNGYSNSQIFDG